MSFYVNSIYMDNTKSNSCISYNTKMMDLIIPSWSTFNNLCTSYDKTEMFLVSVLRLGVTLIILYWFENDENSNDSGVPEAFINKWLYYLVSLLALINIIAMSATLSKTPKYNKKTLQ